MIRQAEAGIVSSGADRERLRQDLARYRNLVSAPIAGAFSRVLEPRVMLVLGLATFGAGVWMTGQMTAG